MRIPCSFKYLLVKSISCLLKYFLSHNNKGFTLIELLVVIAVLGILAAIAIPRLGGVTDRARMSEASSAMGSIKTALEIYSVENGGYPGLGVTSSDFIYGSTATAEFNALMDEYIDNFNDYGVYEGNIDWAVGYTTSGSGFTIKMTDNNGDETYTVTMTYTSGSGYSDVVQRR
jgi:prepilin-type N-terminal cleavage/methylation domain-containing protein